MSYKVLAERLGLSINYFYVLRSTQKESFNYIFSLDNDRYESYIKFKAEVEETRMKLHQIIYKMEDTRGCVYKFSKYLFDLGIFKHSNSFSTLIRGKFSELNDYSYIYTKREQRIIKIYEEFKDTVC